MPFETLLLILAYLVSAWAGKGSAVHAPAAWGPLGAAACVAASVALSAVGTRSIVKRISTARKAWETLVNELARTVVLLRVSLLVLFAGAVYGGGWGAFVNDVLGLGGLPLVGPAVILIPFAVSWMAAASFLYRVEGGESRFRDFLAFRARGAFGWLGLLVAGGGLVRFLFAEGPLTPVFEAHPALEGIVGIALLAGAALSVPYFLRIVWPTRPLPAGALRDTLAAFSRKIGFRYREVRVWETGGLPILNAAVAGLVSPVRVVFLSRGLLENLKEAEILSVFAHEAGHVRGHHAVGGIALAVGWAGFMLSVDGGLLSAGNPAAGYAIQGALTLFFATVWVVQSRRLERAADLFAAEALENPEAVAGTLLRVAMLNGDTRAMRSLTHDSVRSRADSLRKAARLPAEGDRCRRGATAMLLVSTMLMAGGLAAAAPRFLF